jgi:hypothetical protein
MSKYLTPPIRFTEYILDPATDNPHLQIRRMPAGLRDVEKRAWLTAEASNLKYASDKAMDKYNASGSHIYLSFAEALLNEADECTLATKRKYIERQP